MDFRKIQLPREIHTGAGIIENTGSICRDLMFKGKVLVVSGPNTLKIGGEKAIESLQNEDFSVETLVIDRASEEAVQKIQSIADDVSVILGVGGGKVIDSAKLASTRKGLQFISVPTAASHDGIASPRASIRNEKGSVSLEAQAPIGVIADTEIISKAPFKLLAAGFGDIISNYTAILDWKLAYRLLNEYYSDSAAALSLMTAKMTLESVDAIKEGLAGTSRPASGSEHKFSHALDIIAPKPALHGEQCGVGTIMMMYLHGGDWKFIRNALKTLKAPTTASELNMKPEYIIEALKMAHTIRKERYTILGDRGLTREAAEQLASVTGVI